MKDRVSTLIAILSMALAAGMATAGPTVYIPLGSGNLTETPLTSGQAVETPNSKLSLIAWNTGAM